MKFTVLFLIPLVAVLMIGCQESLPVGTASTGTENPVLARPLPINIIDFSYVVQNPDKSLQEILEVSGTIQFTLLQSPILSKDMYNLSCAIEGQVYSIKPKDLMGWTATNSFDQIDFSYQDKGVLIQKSMLVEGMGTPLLLSIKLMVYRDTIQVLNVWLNVPKATEK